MSEKLRGIGELLIESAHIFKRDYRTFLPISGIYAVYLFLVPLLYPQLHVPREVWSRSIFILHSFRLLLYFWVFISLIYVLREADAERRLKGFLKDGVLLIPHFLMGYMISRLFMLFGWFLFIVPMVIFFVWYSLFAYVMVFEGKRGLKSLWRSRNLIRGYWWPVFLRYLLLIVGAVLIRSTLAWVMRGLPNIGLHIAPLTSYPNIIFFDSWRSFFAFPYIFVGAPLLDLFFIPYLVIFVYLIYLDLNRAKEVS